MLQLTAPVLVLLLRQPAAVTTGNVPLAQAYLRPHRTSRVLLEAEDRLRRALVGPKEPVETRETIELIHELRCTAAMTSLNAVRDLFGLDQAGPMSASIPETTLFSLALLAGKHLTEELVVQTTVYRQDSDGEGFPSPPMVRDDLVALAEHLHDDTALARASAALLRSFAGVVSSFEHIETALETGLPSLLVPLTPWEDALNTAMVALTGSHGTGADEAHAILADVRRWTPLRLDEAKELTPPPPPAPEPKKPASAPPVPNSSVDPVLAAMLQVDPSLRETEASAPAASNRHGLGLSLAPETQHLPEPQQSETEQHELHDLPPLRAAARDLCSTAALCDDIPDWGRVLQLTHLPA